MSNEAKYKVEPDKWEPVGKEGKVWHCGGGAMFYEILKHDLVESSYYSTHVYVEGVYATQLGDRGSLPEAKALVESHLNDAINGLVGGLR